MNRVENAETSMSNDALQETEAVYRRQGLGGHFKPVGRPGLLVIDFVNGFADPDLLGGGNIAEAIAQTVPVLHLAREAGWPVAFSRIVYAEGGEDHNLFARKIPAMGMLTEDAASSQVVDVLTPTAGELVVRKTVPSAFLGTGLAGWLVERGVGTLLVAGAVTSGCVRASVVDAMSLGFAPIVLRDCVGDRALPPHEASLFDMQQKYAEVLSTPDAIAMLRSIEPERETTES